MFHYKKLKNRSIKEMSIPNFFWGKTSIKQKPENKQAKKKKLKKNKTNLQHKDEIQMQTYFFPVQLSSASSSLLLLLLLLSSSAMS